MHLPHSAGSADIADSAHSGFYDTCNDTRTLRNVIDALDNVLTEESSLDEHLTRGRLARRLYLLRKEAAA